MAYFQFIVLTLNSLLIALFLGLGVPLIVVERSLLLLFVILLILSPFVMLVVYSIFRRELLVWWISMVGNFLMAFWIGFWYVSFGAIIDEGESSMIIDHVLFALVITVLNLIYLLGSRQRETRIN